MGDADLSELQEEGDNVLLRGELEMILGKCYECGAEIATNVQYFKDDDDNLLCYDCGWPESEEGIEALEG